MANVPLENAGEGGLGSEVALGERVARLEAQVESLSGELAVLRAERLTRHEPAVAAAAVPPASRPSEAAAAFPAEPRPPVASRRSAPKFSDSGARQESLESQLGARVLSKVGVVLLLLGAAWFLKWAFDNRWIGPRGRVLAGLLAGVGVVLWSEHFRRSRLTAFSYALKAVGSGVLYLSLWASFQLYHLVPAPVAFGAMVGVTVWNAVMAWAQDAPVLAGYALLGAYLTPALLSTGGDHEIFLFSYLFTIAASLLGLLRAKPWNALLLGALPVTAIYFVMWYSEFFDASKAGLTAGFALLLWAVFAAVSLLGAEVEAFIPGALVPIGAALFGALTIYSVLVDSGGKEWEPWAAVAFGAVYLALSRWRRGGLVSAVHLSLSVVFLTVAIPLKATGRGITVGWLVEAVALLAIAALATVEDRARAALRWLGWGALLLGVAGAVAEPFLLGGEPVAFFNREFATSLAAVAALAAAIMLAQRMQTSDSGGERLTGPAIAAGSLLLLNLVLLMAMYREIFRAFEASAGIYGAVHEGREYADFCFSAWMMVQGAAMLAAGFWKRAALARWIGLVLLIATVAKTFVYDMRSLGTGYRVVSYLGLGVLLMAVSLAYQKDWLGLLHTEDAGGATGHEGGA